MGPAICLREDFAPRSLRRLLRNVLPSSVAFAIVSGIQPQRSAQRIWFQKNACIGQKKDLAALNAARDKAIGPTGRADEIKLRIWRGLRGTGQMPSTKPSPEQSAVRWR
jgi:hypothetical protein